MAEDTTTIEVKYDTHRALDIRKDVGESFDEVIRRLIDQVAPSVGDIEPSDDIEESSIERIESPPDNATCSMYDIIEGETCGDPATHIQSVTHKAGDETELYLCDRHAGVDDPDVQAQTAEDPA
jgi:predicted CopG family antitoxin